MTTKLSLKTILSSLICATIAAGCAGFERREAVDDIDFDNEAAQTSNQSDDIGGSDASLTVENSITDLRYVSRRGGGTVIVESASPVTFRTRENRELNQFIVDIANATLPDRLKRPYNTKDFGQAIASINAYQDAGSATARVVVQFRTPTRATVTQSGKRLLILAAGPAAPLAKGATERSLADVDEIETLARAASVEGGPGDSRILPMDGTSNDVNRFYGRPISIEVRDMGVRDVINLISEQSGANLVIGSGIEGNITLKLKQIPWDQALMIVLKSNNLGYVRQGSVLRIASNASLQSEAEYAKRILEAQRAAEPVKVKIIPVSYAKVVDLADRLKGILTKDRGSAVPDVRTSTLIVTDTPEVLERASNLIKALDTPPLQVMIEGKVVEAKESFTREFGIDWGYTGQTNVGNVLQNNVRINQGMTPGGSNVLGQFRLGTFDIFGDLDASLGLAESENLAKVVSSPRVVVMNNEKANIEQNLQVYYAEAAPVTVPGVAPTVSYKAVDTKLSLVVTPQVTSEGDVMMDVQISREFPGSRTANGPPPDINKRNAQTKVMVRNGQTAVIGGIYQTELTEGEKGVPYLRNIPVFGWLFKTRSTRDEKNELILFLTPRILSNERSAAKESAL